MKKVNFHGFCDFYFIFNFQFWWICFQTTAPILLWVMSTGSIMLPQSHEVTYGIHLSPVFSLVCLFVYILVNTLHGLLSCAVTINVQTHFLFILFLISSDISDSFSWFYNLEHYALWGIDGRSSRFQTFVCEFLYHRYSHVAQWGEYLLWQQWSKVFSQVIRWAEAILSAAWVQLLRLIDFDNSMASGNKEKVG